MIFFFKKYILLWKHESSEAQRCTTSYGNLIPPTPAPLPAPGGIRSRCLGRWKAPLQQPEHVGALGLRFISSPVPKQTAVWQRKAYAAFHRAQAPCVRGLAGAGRGFQLRLPGASAPYTLQCATRRPSQKTQSGPRLGMHTIKPNTRNV